MIRLVVAGNYEEFRAYAGTLPPGTPLVYVREPKDLLGWHDVELKVVRTGNWTQNPLARNWLPAFELEYNFCRMRKAFCQTSISVSAFSRAMASLKRRSAFRFIWDFLRNA